MSNLNFTNEETQVVHAGWRADPSTNSVQDGFQEGDEFIFLVKKTDGTVYDVDLSYAPAGTMTATNTRPLTAIISIHGQTKFLSMGTL